MKKFFQDFKKFIAKGNVFDMAVGLIIATAFNEIVSSLVDDIIMPLFTLLLGASSLADLSIVLRWSGDSPSLTWNYGVFLQAILNFLIIAFSLFLTVKIISNSQKKLQEFNIKLKNEYKKELKSRKKQLKIQAKQENRPFKQDWIEYKEKTTREFSQKIEEGTENDTTKKNNIEAKVVHDKVADSTTVQTQIELLIEIRDLLKREKKVQFADIEEGTENDTTKKNNIEAKVVQDKVTDSTTIQTQIELLIEIRDLLKRKKYNLLILRNVQRMTPPKRAI